MDTYPHIHIRSIHINESISQTHPEEILNKGQRRHTRTRITVHPRSQAIKSASPAKIEVDSIWSYHPNSSSIHKLHPSCLIHKTNPPFSNEFPSVLHGVPRTLTDSSSSLYHPYPHPAYSSPHPSHPSSTSLLLLSPLLHFLFPSVLPCPPPPHFHSHTICLRETPRAPPQPEPKPHRPQRPKHPTIWTPHPTSKRS
jgi:hypothetical protein